MKKNTDGSLWFTNTEPGNTHHSVEISGGRATGGAGVIWKFKVENKHNDQAVLILDWNHIDHRVKRNTCSDRERYNHGGIILDRLADFSCKST